ncbi:MAG: hypothetical protein IKJ06_05545, partial [Clostridia bacterium]|nr:hypothetical protein [Clostridia bacterium]
INDTGAFNSVFSPRAFVLTYNDGRLLFNTTEEKGQEIRNHFNQVILSALSVREGAQVTEAEWQTLLKSNGIYADYSVSVSTKAITEFLGGTPTNLPILAFDQAVAVFDSIGNDMSVCFRDSKENKQYRVSLPEQTEVKNQYLRHQSGEKESYSYAFEINLDKKVTGSEVQQSVLMDSYVLVPIEAVEMDIIQSENIEFDEKAIENLQKLFGYNPKIARKFIESNGNILFIDRNSTLKLYPESGSVEYTASADGGLTLAGDGNLSSIVSGCGKLLDDIHKLFETEPSVTLFINSPLTERNDNSYTITFDYLFNGNLIQNDTHSCKIVVQDGKIKSFFATISNYRQVQQAGNANALDAIEALYTAQNKEILVIDDLKTGYVNKKGNMEMQWLATVGGQDKIIAVK